MQTSKILTSIAIIITIAGVFPTFAGDKNKQVTKDFFSKKQIIEGFITTVFGAEHWSSNSKITHRVKKFITPVKIKIINYSNINRVSQTVKFVKKLQHLVKGLDISITQSFKKANMFVFHTNRNNYIKVIRQSIPKDLNSSFLESNSCSGLDIINSGSKYNLDTAYVFLVADEGEKAFKHCMYEEILQTLGPVNDNSDLIYSIFNDNSTSTGFQLLDWYIINVLYDSRIKVGMTVKEVLPLLPSIINDVSKRQPKSYFSQSYYGQGGN